MSGISVGFAAAGADAESELLELGDEFEDDEPDEDPEDSVWSDEAAGGVIWRRGGGGGGGGICACLVEQDGDSDSFLIEVVSVSKIRLPF